MAPDSVSFRITRNTEDLAQTIHALSQRLVVMEQRLQAMELQLESRLRQESEPDQREASSLDNVERLLHDCRALLGLEEGSDEHSGAQSPVSEASRVIPDGEGPYSVLESVGQSELESSGPSGYGHYSEAA